VYIAGVKLEIDKYFLRQWATFPVSNLSIEISNRRWHEQKDSDFYKDLKANL
jgi:hypothetical protein